MCFTIFGNFMWKWNSIKLRNVSLLWICCFQLSCFYYWNTVHIKCHENICFGLDPRTHVVQKIYKLICKLPSLILCRVDSFVNGTIFHVSIYRWRIARVCLLCRHKIFLILFPFMTKIIIIPTAIRLNSVKAFSPK